MYRQERHAERKMRLYVFWQLRLGKSLKEVAEPAGLGYRTLQDWVTWYRRGGLGEVLRRIKGHGQQGRPAKLKACQQKALVAKVALGCFRMIWDVCEWVQNRWRVTYSYEGANASNSLNAVLKSPVPVLLNLTKKSKINGKQQFYPMRYKKLN